jgi:adenosylcobinamide amidohydrolase
VIRAHSLPPPALVRFKGSPEIEIVRTQRWLIVRFGKSHTLASWAIVGGGLRRSLAVAWHRVLEDELRPPVDARDLLCMRLRDAGIADAVGLLTSRNLESYVDVTRRYGDLEARCLATVGLGNALRAGDLPGPAGRIGTINVLCRLSVPLSAEALLEALALASEARALAVREASIPSTASGEPASGTGTDCIVIAAPDEHGVPARYTGKHTVLGHLIGTAVREAIAQGVEDWKREQRARR